VLIDTYMPEYDVVERHRIRVRAPAERVFAAVRTADLAPGDVVRMLMAIRALPRVFLHWIRGDDPYLEPPGAAIRLADFERQGFVVLDERAPDELVIGLEGQFWKLATSLRPVSAASFAVPVEPGYARAAWNFAITPEADGSCTLSTETRVRCADARARRRFRVYWALVRPGSGLIRIMMLRSIRREAEAAVPPSVASG
jgi:hypothetical protein